MQNYDFVLLWPFVLNDVAYLLQGLQNCVAGFVSYVFNGWEVKQSHYRPGQAQRVQGT